MKKVLILMLVLGMASLASATLQFVDPASSGSNLSIESTALFVFADSTYIFVVADTTGTVPSGGGLTAAAPDNSGWAGSISGTYPGANTAIATLLSLTAVDGMWGDFTQATGSKAAGIYADSITWAGITYLVGTKDFTTYTLLDTIPEPMTVALLGLGGLFLRRRK